MLIDINLVEYNIWCIPKHIAEQMFVSGDSAGGIISAPNQLLDHTKCAVKY